MEIHSEHIREGVEGAVTNLQREDRLPTLRDHLAMAALQALLQATDNRALAREQNGREVVTDRAYDMADAMMASRKKKGANV